jgi:hypothetical protein
MVVFPTASRKTGEPGPWYPARLALSRHAGSLAASLEDLYSTVAERTWTWTEVDVFGRNNQWNT